MPRAKTEKENDAVMDVAERDAATEALKKRKRAEFDERTKGGE